MKKLIAAAVTVATIAVGIGVGAPVVAQSGDIQSLLDSQMRNARAELGVSGWTSLRQPRASSLSQGESESFTLQLNPGRDYVFVGVCDADCSDMDLQLQDSRGNELASDFAVDDTPVIRFSTPRAVPNARLTVSMAACSVPPCFYQVGSFGRDR
ncbi:MAG: hypothetical protein MUF14_05035 [Hyphomonadaceae bacterium]|nr:hypothetical protein [Hyphomonadaceae bacterium]